MNRAVFLDRDGTIIKEKHFLHHPEKIEILPGAVKALSGLKRAGFLLFIVSNQSGVGRGYFTMADVEAVNKQLLDTLGEQGVRFERVYVAPEAPEVPSRNRKPSPQFLFDARDEFGLDLSRSYIIGDRMSDLECGWNAGLKKSLLVRTGYGAETESTNPPRLAEAVVKADLAEAAAWILAQPA